MPESSYERDYVTIGICVLIFIFEIIIIVYMYFIFMTTTNNIYDTQDLLVTVYDLEILEATNAGIVTCRRIPKRIRQRQESQCKNKKYNESDDGSEN